MNFPFVYQGGSHRLKQTNGGAERFKFGLKGKVKTWPKETGTFFWEKEKQKLWPNIYYTIQCGK